MEIFFTESISFHTAGAFFNMQIKMLQCSRQKGVDGQDKMWMCKIMKNNYSLIQLWQLAEVQR